MVVHLSVNSGFQITGLKLLFAMYKHKGKMILVCVQCCY